MVQWGSHLFGADDSEESGRIGVVGGMGPLDPRQAPNERDLVMEMNVDDDQEEMLDYFNTTFMKNWAGPEHLEVTTRSKGTYVPQLYKHTFYWLNRHHIAADGTSDAPRVRREEAAFTIDSLNPAGQELFVPAAESTVITLPTRSGAATGAGTGGSGMGRTGGGAGGDDRLLPGGMHFTSQHF